MNDENNLNINFDGGLGDNQIPGLTDTEAIFPGSEGPIIELTSNSLLDISGGVEAIEESVVVVGDGEGAIGYLEETRSQSSVGETDSLTGEVIETSAIQTRSASSNFIKKEVFNSGKFVVGETGEVSIDYLFDGGWYRGELGVFSLAGIDELEIRSYEDFVKEASRRALSNSELGYVVLDDRQDGAYFGKGLGLRTWNKNSYQGPQILEMNSGDEFALMLMPHGRIEEAFNNPKRGGHKRPLFSLSSENQELGFPVGQIADITGDGKIFGFEDVKVDTNKADRNYSDVVISIEGAEGEVSQLDEVINPKKDWRSKPIFEKLEDVLEFPNIAFNSGKFVVGETGEVSIDYLFDGGWYQGELGIFSLDGLEEKSYEGFVKEAANRALSNSELGYIAIRDPIEGAKFEGRLGERNFNSGEYLGEKTFEMNPGDNFAFIFVPNGSIEGVFNNPKRNGSKGPLFSLVTENPDDEFRPGQIGDVTGEGVIFAFEDLKVKNNNNVDRDYNDFIFSVNGVEDASGVVVDLDEVINPEKDWRDEELAEELISSVKGNAPQDLLLLTDLFYNPGETPNILGKVSDADGGSDIAKIDFWLQRDGGEWEDIADVTEFVVDDGEADEVRFAYELAGLEAGKYRLKAIAYDLDGNEHELTEYFTVLSLAADEELSSRVKWAIERAMNLDSYDPDVLAATRQWVVSVKAGESAAALASSFGWNNLGSTGHIPNTYIWEFGEDTAPEDVAKQLSLLPEVEFAYPLVPVELQWMSGPADEPLVKDGSQWHLRSDVNVADANVTNVWESGVTGEGVVIGVVDDGFEIDDPEKGLVGHEDLLPNYRADLSYDFGEEDPYPSRLINGVVTSPESAIAIVDGGNAVSQLHSSLSGFVKGLQLEFNLNHEDVSNLEVALVSPGGTEKLLTEVVNGTNVIDLGEVFEKERALGNWRLEVKDNAANGKKGILGGWSLELETVNIHGTAVAGVAVAAGDNNVGGSGVAPEAEWAGLRINAGPKPLTGDVLAKALSWESQEIDIYSNSYGPGFFDVLPGVEYSLEKMTAEGRDGKGNIYAFAGGNGADAGGNVNYNSLANSRQTIAVAAIDGEGKRPFYSELGAAVLVSAYSDNAKEGDEFVGITTTGPDNKYIDYFTGTSASTPFVAGGVGLMLEANPNLTVRDVQHILVESANQNDPTDGDWVENGGGYQVNHQYGFGAIDVEDAVQLAKDWTPVNKEVKVSRVEWEGTGPIPDYDASKPEFLTSTIAIDEADDISVEWVEVMFNGEHRYLGELEIVLISPDGTESVLTSPHTRNEKYGGDRFNSLAHWTFTSARHWGESSVGDWQLRVADKKEGTRSNDDLPGKRNYWTSWQLNLYGTEPNTAPEATNLNQELNYTEEVAIALNDIVVADPDAGDRITVNLELNNPAGGTIATGEDESDAEGALSFEGSVTDVNGWLAGLEFTPAKDFSDNLEVTVAVTDNNISWPVTGTINLLGEADNDAPTVAQEIPNQTATEDEPFEFVLPAGTFADVDDESLNYSATVGGWLSFDGATGIFSGTPINEDVGTVEVTVTAADAEGAEVSDEFVVTVENVNDAPTVVKEIGDQTATVGEMLRFAFPEDTFADVDAGDSLFYNVTLEDGSPLPDWLGFDSATRTFLAMPGSEDVGSLSVKVEARDKEDASVSDVFVLTVEDAAQLVDLRGQSFMVTSGALAAGDNFNLGFMLQNVEAGDAGEFEVGFYLSEDEAIDESDRFLGSYTVGALAGNGGTGNFLTQQLPEAGDEFWKGDGSYFVGMVVDVGGAIAESNEDNNAGLGAGIDYATIEVNNTEPLPTNTPPTLTAVSTLTGATEGEAFTITYEELLAASDAADADGDTLTFQIEGLLSGELTKDGETVAIGATVLAAGEEIVWTPDVVGDAVSALSVKAFDGEDYSDVAVEVVVAVEEAIPIQPLVKLGDEFQVNSYTTDDQEDPSVAALPDGGFVVVWHSESQNGGTDDIYGQRYDRNGVAVGNEFMVNSYKFSRQWYPSIAELSDGGFVVTWTSDNYESGASYEIHGQRYDINGNPEGDEFRINTYTPGYQMRSSATGLTDGGFVVTWESNGQDGNDYGIFGQRYDGNSNPVGSEFQVNTYADGGQVSSSVTALSNGGFVVVWQTAALGNSTSDVRGQQYDSNGNPVGEEFIVNTHTDDMQNSPTAIALSDGSFVVSWQSYRQEGSRDYGIYGQLYNSSGNPIGDEFHVNTYTDGSQTNPKIIALPNQKFAIIWNSEGKDGNGKGIYGQRYDSSGNRIGTEFQLDTEPRAKEVAQLTNGDLILALSDLYNGQDSSGKGVFAQRFGIPTSNQAPTLTSVSNLTGATESTPFKITYEDLVNAADEGDADGDDIYFQINSLLSGTLTKDGKLVQPEKTTLAPTEELIWIPDKVGESVQAFTINAFDGKDKSADAVEVAIAVNDPPTIESKTYAKTGSAFQINTYTDSHQKNPSIATLLDESFVVIWESELQDGSNTGIYGQRYDSKGDPLGNEFQINTFTNSTQGNPSIAALDDGGFVVVWESDYQDGSDEGIYGQRYDSNGHKVGQEFQVNSYTDRQQSDPSVVALPNGEFFVTWNSLSDVLNGYKSGKRFYNNGESGPEFSFGKNRNGQIVGLSDGSLIATDGNNSYLDNVPDDIKRYDSYATLIDVTSTASSLVDERSAQNTAKLYSLQDGGFVAIRRYWDDEQSHYNILAQRYDANNESVGSEFNVNKEPISSFQGGQWLRSSFTSLSDGSHVIVWGPYRETTNDPYGYKIQRYDSNLTPLGDAFQVNPDTVSSLYPTIKSLPNGGFLVVWQGNNNGSDIFGQRFSVNNPPTLTNISTLTGATESQPYTITYDNLLAASNATDADGDALTFQIEESSSGTLTKNGETVAPGATVLTAGEQLIWTPDITGDTVKALSVKAFDGKESSDTAVEVTVAVNAKDSSNFIGVRYGITQWADYDSDGDLDILIAGDDTNGLGVSKIYRNDSGNFTDIEADIVGVGDGSAGAWGDYDNDGDLDLILAGETGTADVTKLYNNDSGNFIEVEIELPQLDDAAAAWGDYDNDGDLDLALSGIEGTTNVSKIYQNQNGNFVDIAADIEAVAFGPDLQWGDYDSDGDLDLLLTGGINAFSGVATIYRNDGGNFVDINAGLPGVNVSSAAWGDYDSDGDLDIAINGASPYFGSTTIYRNDGGNFVDINAGLTGLLGGSVNWGDYDNDGDLDLLITGSDIFDGASKIYTNNGGNFVELETDLPNLVNGKAAFGDYDSDGDLDILLTGHDRTNAYTQLYNNNLAPTANTAPTAPTGLSGLVNGSDVTFSWNGATDAETPTPGLTYNLRVGTTPGGSEVVSPGSLVGGDRLIPAKGNVDGNTSWIVKNLEPGTYYWSVQAVDSSFTGSEFATEGTFTVKYQVSLINPN